MPDRAGFDAAFKVELLPARTQQFSLAHAQREQQFDGEQIIAAKTWRIADALEQLDQFLVRQGSAAGPFWTTGVQTRREVCDGIVGHDTPAYAEGKDASREAQ